MKLLDEKVGLIYRAIAPNGKVYIGKTTNLDRRKIQHKSGSKKSHYKFHVAIRKFGIEGFTWDILHKNVPVEKLVELEIEEIKKHNSFRNGLNSTPGGDGIIEHSVEALQKMRESKLGKKMPENVKKKISETMKTRPSPSSSTRKLLSEKTRLAWKEGRKTGIPCKKEVKKKLSEIHTGRVLTNEWKNKISITRKNKGIAEGQNNPMYGKRHSLETRKKISQKLKGNQVGDKNARAKITYEVAEQIRKLHMNKKNTYQELGVMFNISDTTVWRIINNYSWVLPKEREISI